MLAINGSDIARLELAWAETDADAVKLSERQTINVGPEGFLAAFTDYVGAAEPSGLIVVVGPGSATALRTILSIANTLAFTKGIQLYGVRELVSGMTLPEPSAHLEPVYANDPKITSSPRDALRRKH